MAKVTVSMANRNVFCVFVGPCPVFCCFAVLLVAKRKSGWGICGSFLVAVVVLFWFSLFFRDDLPKFLDHTCPCTFLLFTAYAIVRTEPSANRPNRREKKNWLGTSLLHARVSDTSCNHACQPTSAAFDWVVAAFGHVEMPTHWLPCLRLSGQTSKLVRQLWSRLVCRSWALERFLRDWARPVRFWLQWSLWRLLRCHLWHCY